MFIVDGSRYDQYDVTAVIDLDFTEDWRHLDGWIAKAVGRNSAEQMGDPNKTLKH